jgi:hypothetical protein
VAVAPRDEGGATRLLSELRVALENDRLSSLILLFADGLRAEVHKAHRWRVWRRRNTLLEGPRDNGSRDREPADERTAGRT